MATAKFDISVVIVNYKVKEYIANLLNSLEKAKHDLKLEIFVVDNNSGDNSTAYLREKYPYVNYIENSENVGFGKANNQAIELANSDYTLIINPDTLVAEDTLTTLVHHLETHPKCGAAGCKILNPDGTFAPESRRSVPSIWTAACKVFGLNFLFPKSKWFGQYYLSWLDEDEASKVPVLSGSFMFWRTDLLKQLKGFDERFFMYGEDIDLCYRVKETGFHIDYVPSTSIIHYKGESTKKGDLRYIKLFNKALYQFFEKTYSARYSWLFKVLIYLAVLIKTITSFFITRIKNSSLILADLLIINLSLVMGFLIRFSFDFEAIIEPTRLNFLYVNLILSGLYVVAAAIFGLFKEHSNSLSAHLKAIILPFFGFVIISSFAKELAYSRLILGVSFVIGILLTIVHRLYKINSSKSLEKGTGRIRSSKILIVGEVDETIEISEKIRKRPDWNYEVVGIVTLENVQPDPSSNVIGSISQLNDLIKAYKIEQVFFALKSISYKQMLQEISSLQSEKVLFKLIPDNMDFILGKSNVEYLESIPLVKVEFDYDEPVNKFLKRTLDFSLALPFFLFYASISFPFWIFGKNNTFTHKGMKLYSQSSSFSTYKNKAKLMLYTLSGKLSFVGAPLSSSFKPTLSYKMGITGIGRINNDRIDSDADLQHFEVYYVQNYSIWMDVDILAKSLIKGINIKQQVKELESKA